MLVRRVRTIFESDLGSTAIRLPSVTLHSHTFSCIWLILDVIVSGRISCPDPFLRCLTVAFPYDDLVTCVGIPITPCIDAICSPQASRPCSDGVCCVATELPSGRPRVRRRRCREAGQQHRTRHAVAAGPVASRAQTERESRTATWSPRAKRDAKGSRGPERTGKKYHTDCAKHVLGTHVMPVLNTMLHPWPRIGPRSSRLRRRGPPKVVERGGPRKSVEEWSHVEWS